jgi:hypothetical protein
MSGQAGLLPFAVGSQNDCFEPRNEHALIASYARFSRNAWRHPSVVRHERRSTWFPIIARVRPSLSRNEANSQREPRVWFGFARFKACCSNLCKAAGEAATRSGLATISNCLAIV